MARVRSVDFLPEIFQTDVNKQFLSATLDQLIQEPQFKKTQGFIGETVGPGVNPADKYVIEPNKTRADYQLEPGVISLDPLATNKIKNSITYPGINDALDFQGANSTRPDRLYQSQYYSWDPFVDFDTFVNFSQYYWIENGPDVVSLTTDGIPLVQTFDVTRANGVYTFSGVDGELPTINLVRGGNYVFNVAQNNVETVNYRVTRTNVTSFNIDFQPNATLTLVRGNTYTFTLNVNGDFPFWIKTSPTTGTGEQYNLGVQRNGAVIGTVTFTVPQTAPNQLFYSCQTQSLMNGVINVVDGTPGTGSKFWIQTAPGISGRNPTTPNISSREVLGVINNGTDLGSVVFNVPSRTAQNFYYSLAELGTVDLVTDLKFDQIDGVKLSDFISQYGGIDGITNLNSRTLIFTNNIVDPVEGGWFYHSTPTVTPVDPTQYFSIWRLTYYTDNDEVYMALGSIATFPQLNQASVLYGTVYSSTQWWKTSGGLFEQVPVLSAEQDVLYYQDSTDPEIFGRIRLLEPTSDSTIYIDEIVGQTNYTSPNGVVFSNGLKVRFLTDTVPSSYATRTVSLLCVGTQAGLNMITCETTVGLAENQTIEFDGAVFGGVQANVTYFVKKVFSTSQFSISTVKGGPAVPLSSAFGLMSAVASQNPEYYVSGVGSAISLLPVENYVSLEVVPVEYQNFGTIDYLTINRDSPDLNAWSRSNRWFHIDVLTATGQYNDTPVVLNNELRAKRPIIQFRGGIKLYNMGTQAKQPVDVIDFLETDALSNVEGSTQYTVYTSAIAVADLIIGNTYQIVNLGTTNWNAVAGTNGVVYAQGDVFQCVQKGTGTGTARSSYDLVDGTRVIFAADDDADVRNKVYTVNFIVPDSDPPLPAPYTGQPIIHLTLADDGLVLPDQSLYCTQGEQKGVTFWYDGVEWTQAQLKQQVQQAPLFDVYDADGISYSNQSKYPSSTFAGTKLFSYAQGSGLIDPVLKFKLQYLTLQNVGDIVFDNNLYKDTFVYVVDNASSAKPLSSGFVRQYVNRTVYSRLLGWQTAVVESVIRQQIKFIFDGVSIKLDVAALPVTETVVPPIQIYVNSEFRDPSTYTVTVGQNSTVIDFATNPPMGSIIEVAVLSNQISATGFFQVPINLEKNPINANSDSFTLGTIRQQYESICENLTNLVGVINGANNTRDLGNIVPYGQIILQQSSPLTMAGYFMRSEQYNIFGALDYNSKEYQKFKNQMLEAVTQQTINFQTTAQILDTAIAEITTGKTQQNPFYWSDMLPATSVFTTTTYTITPISRDVFDTVQVYNYTSANYQGINVYLNSEILTRGLDYTVATDGPRITVLISLTVGDVLTLQEYTETYGTYVPNTPSKMGLYPLWRPRIIEVKTSSGTTQVIQGHDGSQTPLFGDIRDDVLLEFETRIFNNCKLDGNPVPLSLYEVLPGQFRDTGYSYEEITEIFNTSFLTYVGWNKLDYTRQDYIANNAFTYNYSNAENKLNNENLLGAWRGINRFFYDTQQPQQAPWEMLGFSIKPDWWNIEYSGGPWTQDNLNLWDDLEIGLVRDPLGQYILPQFARPGLTKVIPTNSQGELLPPLDSVVGIYANNKFRRSWSPGDGGPVEASWLNSSDYPFAVMRLLALTRPAKFFSLFADRDLYRFSAEFNQYLFDGRYRLTTRQLDNQTVDTNITVYGDGTSKASYINWIVDYNRITGTNATKDLQADLKNIDVRLCYRLASFSDKQYIKLYVEKSSPNTLNTTLLIPDESYQLLLYKNQPFDRATYSAVVVQVVAGGYAVYGYSITQPYFSILNSVPVGTFRTFTVAGATVQVPTLYSKNVTQVPYGFVFSTKAAVADFLLSYGKLLEQQGFVFDNTENGFILDWSQMVQEFLYWSQQGWNEGSLINLNPLAAKVEIIKEQAVVDTINTQTIENNVLNQNRQLFPTRDLNIVRTDNTFKIEPLIDNSISFVDLRFTSYESMIVLDNASLFGDLIYNPVTGARQSRMYLNCFNTTQWNGTVDAQGFILNQDNIQEWTGLRTYTKGELVKYKNAYWSAAFIVQPSAIFNYNDWIQSDYTLIELGLLPNIANKADQLANSYNINSANLESDNDLLSYGVIGYRPRQYFAALNLDDVSQINVYRQFLDVKGTLQSIQLLGRAKLNKEVADYSVYENWAVLRSTYGANANRSYIDLRLNRSLLTANPSTIELVTPNQASQANQSILISDVWKASFVPNSTNVFPTIESSITDTALPTAGYVNFNDADITTFSLDDPAALAANIDSIKIGTSIWAAKINNYDWGIYRAQNVPAVITHVCENLDGTCLVRFNNTHGLAVGAYLIVRYFDFEVDGVYRVIGVPDINSVTIILNLQGDRTVVQGTGIGFTLKTMRVAQASDIVNLPYAKEIQPGAKVWVDNNGQNQWQVLQKTDPFTNNLALSPKLLDASESYGASVAQCVNRSALFVGSPRYGFASGPTVGGVYLYVKNLQDQYEPISPLDTEDAVITSNTTGLRALGSSLTAGSREWAASGAPASLGPSGQSNNGYVAILYRDPDLGNPGEIPWTVSQLLTQPTTTPSTTPGAGEFGSSVAMSSDERWLYVGAPGLDQVHAYGRVDWQFQIVKFIGSASTTSQYIGNVIQVNNVNQLTVTFDGRLGVLGVDYSVNGALDTVTFLISVENVTVAISRNFVKSYTGGGTTFTVSTYLFTAVNIDSISVYVDNVIQRPNIDYTYDGTTLTFASAVSPSSLVSVEAKGYWAYVATLTGSGVNPGDRFGQSVATSTDGRNVIVGCKNYILTGAIDSVSSTGLAANGLVYYNGVVQSSTSGNGRSAKFNVLVYQNTYTVTVIDPGYDYAASDTIVIKGSVLGGTDDINDLEITVSSIQSLTEAGAIFVFDRNVQKFIYGSTDSTVSFTVIGSLTAPVSVIVNNVFLLNAQDSTIDQSNSFTVAGSTVTINADLVAGDVIQIETNQFVQQQRVVQDVVEQFSNYGTAVDLCSYNCSLYGGAPQSSLAGFKAGIVERNVNQARTYGIIRSTVSNPTLSAGQTLRVNNVDVVVPDQWNFAATYNLGAVVYVLSTGFYTFYQALQPVPAATLISNTSYWKQLDTWTAATYAQLRGLAYAVSAQAPNATAAVDTLGYFTVSVSNSDAAPTGDKLEVAPGSTGTVYTDLGFDMFVFTQAIASPLPQQLSEFGATVSVDNTAINLVVGAPKASLYIPILFDIDPTTQEPTTVFDADATEFFTLVAQSGAVYTYDYLPSAQFTVSNPGKFVFGQQVQTTGIASYDQYGTAISFDSGLLVATAPGADLEDSTAAYGVAYIYENATQQPAWQVQYQQQPAVDVRLLSSVYMYDRITSAKTEFFDFFDPLQGKILGAAASNIDFISSVDPAQYNVGQINNVGSSWNSTQLGKVWWNISTVRFIDPNQDSITYAARRWGQVFPGSQVDVYQWTASTVPPAQYTGPGVPFSVGSYSVQTNLNNTGTFNTTYYYWVRGLTTTDANAGKTLSVQTVANYIADPKASGIAWVAAINSSTIAIYNGLQYVNAADTILSIEYDQTPTEANVHQEFELIAQGRGDAFLSDNLYRKMQDSFCGFDTAGNLVPDPYLPPAQKYGISFRPRQSMFADRFLSLENYIKRTNSILAQYPITEIRSFSLLNSQEATPPAAEVVGGLVITNWNLEVANLEILSFQNIYSVPLGYKYLVLSDSNNRGLWTIYTVTTVEGIPGERQLLLTKVQNFKTSDYWFYIDWYLPGYNVSSQIVAEVPNFSSLVTLTVPIGSSVKVTTNAQGKFEIYLLTDTGWTRVGLEDGTIEISPVLYNYSLANFGFDLEVFDSQYFAQEPTIETRKIIQAINQELLIDDLAVERNTNLVTMFDFILSEFTAPEWLVKTSLIDVDHKIRELIPFQNYIRDNQDFVLDYIQEVKPYHVQIREFNLQYSGIDQYQGDVTDFDLPAFYDTTLTVPQFVSPILLPYAQSSYQPFNINSNVPPSSTLWSDWPYNQWYNNFLLTVDEITVSYPGSGYLEPPVVTIQTAPGDSGSGAKAVANINSQGQVTSITLIEPGVGYRSTPTIVFSGVTTNPARAYAVMSNALVRQFKTVLKFDRYQYQTLIENWSEDGTYENGIMVRYDNRVWRANNPDGSSAVIGPSFELDQWQLVPASELSGVDRTMGFYVPGVNEVGLDLNQLIPGTSYPGVQVWGDYFLGSSPDSLTVTCTSTSESSNSVTCNNTLRMTANAPIRFYGVSFGGIVTGQIYYVYEIVSTTEFKLTTVANGSVLPLTDGTGTLVALIPEPLDAQYASSFTDQYLGLRPTDINVQGGQFIGTTEGHAPEELINGMEFDTVDIRVYTRPGSDWTNDGHGFQFRAKNYIYDSLNNTFSWAGVVEYPTEIVLSNATSGLYLAANLNYTVSWANQTVTVLDNAAVDGDVISITVYETGGGSQLFRGVYNGADITNFVIVPVNSAEIYEIPVFVDGVILTGITWEPYATSMAWSIFSSYSKQSVVNNSGIYYRALQTVPVGIEILDIEYWQPFVPTLQSKVFFNTTISESAGVSLVVMGVENPQYGWSTPQTQYFTVDESIFITKILTCTNSLQGTNPANLIVNRNGLRLRPPEGIEWFGDGTSVEFGLPQRGGFSQELINAYTDVTVWVDNVLQTQSFGAVVGDYSVTNWDGSNTPGRQVVFANPPVPGARILISVDTLADYQVVPGFNQILLSTTVNLGDIYAVITFNDTRQQDLLTLVFSGPVYTGAIIVEGYDDVAFDAASIDFEPGSYDYSEGIITANNAFYLQRPGITAERLWVTINGSRLIEGQDYSVLNDYLIIASGVINGADIVVVTEFTQDFVPEAMAFRIFQDMRGVQTTFRITANSTTVLVQDLSDSATIMYVDNASALTQPNLELGYFGIVTVDGERILYRDRDLANNILLGLQRGTAGTAAASHSAGAEVYDMGVDNRMPVNDQNYIVSTTSLGNGTTTVYTATDIQQSSFGDSSSIFRESIEVYVGGLRSRIGILPSSVTIGNSYTIASVGNTDWYAMGLSTEIFPAAGVVFTVLAVGSGTGLLGESLAANYYEITNENPLQITFFTRDDLPAPADGVEVTLLQRRGVNWYQPSLTEASNGRPLQITQTTQARFLRGL